MSLIYTPTQSNKINSNKIDDGIYQLCRAFNDAGGVTLFSCSGLDRDHIGRERSNHPYLVWLPNEFGVTFFNKLKAAKFHYVNLRFFNDELVRPGADLNYLPYNGQRMNGKEIMMALRPEDKVMTYSFYFTIYDCGLIRDDIADSVWRTVENIIKQISITN